MHDDETVVPVTLQPGEAVFVVFRQKTDTKRLVLPAKPENAFADLDANWTVRFQEGRGAPESIHLDQLTPQEKNVLDGVKCFSGVATYSRTFSLPKGRKPGSQLWLDLGAVGDLAQVSVNGRDVGTVWHTPYRVNIGEAVHKCTNLLEIRVANTWVNRLIGDAQQGAAKVTWTAMPTYPADAPLRSAGLIGPVTIMGE